MRIIGGALKNIQLKTPLGFQVRPTSEKVREALFNILRDTIEGSRFLDLYAGSGAVGIEAASRGATKVTFVEEKSSAIKVLRSNLQICHLQHMATVIHFDVIGTVRTLNNRQLFFDHIFLDPPYEGEHLATCLQLMSKYPIMTNNSIIICQSFYKTPLVKTECIKPYRQDKYGETMLSFYRWGEATG
ncbi:16S rRNA (guanine(966)-N(2))-methyltransferase RsmD [bacterium]|nr:16S rRNA (guanine(966)-N(2))-methyltransferase RsmD [bacterium]